MTLVCGQRICETTQEDSGSAEIDRFEFALSLPRRDFVVELTDVQLPGVINLVAQPDSVLNLTDGRLSATITIAEQPSKSDNYEVRILTKLPSLSQYALTMTWLPAHVEH